MCVCMELYSTEMNGTQCYGLERNGILWNGIKLWNIEQLNITAWYEEE